MTIPRADKELLRSARDEVAPRITIIVVIVVVSKALRAGQDSHAENQVPGMAGGLGTCPCRV